MNTNSICNLSQTSKNWNLKVNPYEKNKETAIPDHYLPFHHE